MRVVGITTVKDEADIIATTIDHMAKQVDYLLVADNLSTDGTAEILRELASIYPLDIISDTEPAHYQGRKMTILSRMAWRQYGADWVVPFDADELWCGVDMRVRDYLESVPEDAAIVRAELYDHVPTDLDDRTITSPQRRITWRRLNPSVLPKVAVRSCVPVVIRDGNHGADYPAAVNYGLVVHHFPYRSAAHFVAKARKGSASIALTDLPESTGQHWRDYGRILDEHGPEMLEQVFYQHFYSTDPEHDPFLVRDPALS